jgi:hypothetical protein
MSCDNNATWVLFSRRVAIPKKKSDFSSDKCAAYGKRGAYQNIHFILRPYFVQNKYVSHKKNCPPNDQQRPQQFKNLCIVLTELPPLLIYIANR